MSMSRVSLQLHPLEDRQVPATFTVSNANDAGAGSLRQAILDAAANTEGDAITFSPALAGQTISLTSNSSTDRFGPTALVLTNDTIVIDGAGAPGVTLSGENARRLFAITPTAKLALFNITLSGGRAQGGSGGSNLVDDGGGGGGGAGLGGAIYNEGTLVITGSTLIANTALGGNGGNGGPNLGNPDGGGGAGGGGLSGNGGSVSGAADGGAGGGGSSVNGADNVGQTTAGAGGGGATGGLGGTPGVAGGNGSGPGGGGGGGGDEANGGSGNFGGGGGGAGERDSGGVKFGGNGGFGGGGGGAGEDGSGGNGGFGGGGGGAAPNGGLGDETTGTGGYGAGNGGSIIPGSQSAGGGGGAGFGGAIFNNTGSITITNSTITGNNAVGGTGGAGTTTAENGFAGTGQGGGIFNRNGTLTIVNSTLSGNSAANGGRQLAVLADGATNTATVNLRNSIFGQADKAVTDVSTAANESGTLGISGSGNLIRTSTGLPAAVANLTTDPQLGDLGNNGGPTQTLLPTITSPVRGAGTPIAGLTVDQRGQPRPAIGPNDLGAVQRSGSPNLIGLSTLAVGADRGGSPTARVFDHQGKELFSVEAFDAGFTGGVRTAMGDFNADGVNDLVVGTGPGAPTQVRVIDGKTQAEIFANAPFEAAFTGGVFVAAGDITGDGVPELIITPDEGGGPRVRVFNGVGFGQLNDFYGIDDPNFRGGARAAVGDLNADGIGDLAVAAGFGGGPRLAAYNGASVATGTNKPDKFFGDFFVFEQTLSNGVFLTLGDLNGDGFADVVVGGGPGGGPRVLALSGQDLIHGTQTTLANFFGGNADSRGGIRLAVKNLDGDVNADLVVGAGVGSGSQFIAYAGKAMPVNGVPSILFSPDAFPGFTGGVFVG